jgi:hypothetical protein
MQSMHSGRIDTGAVALKQNLNKISIKNKNKKQKTTTNKLKSKASPICWSLSNKQTNQNNSTSRLQVGDDVARVREEHRDCTRAHPTMPSQQSVMKTNSKNRPDRSRARVHLNVVRTWRGGADLVLILGRVGGWLGWGDDMLFGEHDRGVQITSWDRLSFPFLHQQNKSRQLYLNNKTRGKAKSRHRPQPAARASNGLRVVGESPSGDKQSEALRYASAVCTDAPWDRTTDFGAASGAVLAVSPPCCSSFPDMLRSEPSVYVVKSVGAIKCDTDHVVHNSVVHQGLG